MGGAVGQVAMIALSASAAYTGGIGLFGVVIMEAGFGAALVAGIGSFALGFITQALAPKPEQPTFASFDRQAQDNVLTVRQAAAPRKIGFGRARVGGVYTFLHTTGSDNSVLHAVVTVTGHAVRSFDALFLDDEVVPLDSNGDATGKYAGKVSAKFGLGTTAGDSGFNSALTAAVTSDKWGTNHRQSGCAKAYIKFTYDGDLFGGGLPNPSFVVSAFSAVEDARFATSPVTTGWTDNAALCIAQYLRDTARGLGYPSADINAAALTAAANDCDEMVDRVSVAVTFTVDTATDILTLADTSAKLRTGTRFQVSSNVSPETLPAGLSSATNYFWDALTPTTGRAATSLANARAQSYIDITSAGSGTLTLTVNAEPRYTLNGWIDTSEDPEQVLPRLLAAMAGTKTESGGEVFLFAGVWRAAANSIDEDDLDGPIVSRHRRSKRDLFNGIKGVFVNPDDNWQPTDFPVVKPAAYLTEDGSERIWKDADLRFTDSPSMAQRIVRIDLEKTRRQQTASMPLTLRGLKHRAADTISLTNVKRGYVAKTFMVARWGLELRDSGGENPRIGTVIDLDETDANVYAWTPGTDEAAMKASPLTTLPDPFTAAAPTSLVLSSGTAVLGTRLDGTIFSRIKLTWTAPADAQVTSGGRIEIEYKKSALSVWLDGGSVDGAATEGYILDVDDGVSYDVRIRSRRGGALQARSSYLTVTGHTVAGKTALPSNVTSLTVQQNGNVSTFSWPAITDVDRAGYELRYMAAPFVWTSARLISRETKGTLVTNTALPPGTWEVGIKAVDTSGNYSTTATTATITVVNVNTAVAALTDSPRWPGELVGLVRHDTSGTLIPRSATLASAMTDSQLYDSFVNNPVASPYYESGAIDLGFDANGVRVWGAVGVALGPGETGTPSGELQIDYRDDAASYDGFEAWPNAAEADFRHLKGRVVLNTSDGVESLQSFMLTTDAGIRTEQAASVVIAASGTAITFTSQFHTVPAITVTPQSGTALQATAASPTATGFTAHIFNDAGTDVGGTLQSWTARGS